MTTNNPDSFFFPNPIAKQLAVTYFFSLSVVFSLVKFQWLFTVLLWNTHTQSVHIHIYVYSCVCRVTGGWVQGSEHTPADNHLYSVMVPALKSGGLASGLLQPLSHYLAGLTLPPPWTLVLAVFFFLIWHITCKLKGWDILIWYISIL